MTPDAPAGDGATDVMGDEGVGAPGVVGKLATQDPSPPVPESWPRRVRRSFLFWPVVAYLAARAVTIAFLLVADRTHHEGLAGRAGTAGTGPGFLRAAEQGWPRHLPMVHGHVAANTSAFFPVFPVAIRWLASATSLSPLAWSV